MGTAASTAVIPEQLDKTTAQTLAGDKFDDAAFNAAATEGKVSRDEFFRAAAAVPARELTDLAKHEAELVTAALSLAREKRSDDFLSCEVKEKTDQETLFITMWQHIDRGQLHEALSSADELISRDSLHEKAYYARAIAYARLANWRYALADFSSYLKHVQLLKGPQLANAYYGRALCLAKLGQRGAALKDLDACIRVGPQDEQATDDHPSLVPNAMIARFVLLTAHPELARQAAAQAALDENKAAASAASVPSTSGASAQEASVYEGALWRVAVTDLEIAVERAFAARKTPLLLDRTQEPRGTTVDQYYMYSPATVVEGKRTVLEVRVSKVPLEQVREGLRLSLVHALRWGHTLLIRLTNTAADFEHQYCDAAYFPVELFDAALLPCGIDAAASSLWSKVLRPADLRLGGQLNVPASFRVVVTSGFAPESFEDLLKDSLPLAKMQPVHIFQRGAHGAPSAEVTPKPGAPKARQLTGDRTSLILQNAPENTQLLGEIGPGDSMTKME